MFSNDVFLFLNPSIIWGWHHISNLYKIDNSIGKNIIELWSTAFGVTNWTALRCTSHSILVTGVYMEALKNAEASGDKGHSDVTKRLLLLAYASAENHLAMTGIQRYSWTTHCPSQKCTGSQQNKATHMVSPLSNII